jgi:hypothetical protein
MGLSFLLVLQASALAGPPSRSQRTDLPPLGDLPSATRSAAPEPAHRLLHPIGPEPESWDGDWPELDMDLTLALDAAGPFVPADLNIRLCWCPEVHRSARALPGAGIGDAWRDHDDDD